MKKLVLVLALAATMYSCKKPDTYQYDIEDVSSQFQNLPALQSFSFGIDSVNNEQYWIMFGGRTNGFHGFGGQSTFPIKKSNDLIYVYNASKGVLDSLHVDSLPVILSTNLKGQFTSTNMQCRQVDSFLYVSGGYGAVVSPANDTSWITQNLLTRIHIKKMIKAILAKDTTAMKTAIAYDTSSFVAATGGELYKMADNKFYLVVGHNYTGKYNPNFPNPSQVYLDAVHVFSLKETPNSIKIDTTSFKSITDGLKDSVTQFRRRDLNVVPAVQANGNYGISIYSGVFTTTNGGQPFRYPIYISPDASSYRVDSSFKQFWNVYSAPNFTMYDAKANRVLTTIFGGLGDTLASNIGPSNNLPNGPDSAAFTKFITTLERSYNGTSSITKPNFNSTGMPDYIGAEGVFIPAPGLPLYKNNNLGIVDFNQIPESQKIAVGYIYGGIHSDSTQWNNLISPKLNITHPSNKVYKVSITKTPATK